MSTRDESRPVRDEDAFDVEAVAAWLREHAPSYELVGLPAVRQFPGGASNLTYLLSYPGRDLILRRPPVGAQDRSAHDMGREHDIQAALAPVFPYVATMVGLCRDESVIGSEFYVMERLEGTIPRRELPFEATPEAVSELCGRAFDVLADLHAVDVSSLPALAALNRGEGYVARQVAGWTDRLARAATDDLGDWAPVTAWLKEHQPADVRQCLVHNDFRFDNLVLAADPPLRVSGVLDWEMATVGDPLSDVASLLVYWTEPGDEELLGGLKSVTSEPTFPRRGEVLEMYARASGRELAGLDWYLAFAYFKLAVICQQIFYRWHVGQTRDARFQGHEATACNLIRHAAQLTTRGL
jgi:aminoglycoside phosphotransferase (APT) family kinase protein